jgi:hypothetical protein
MLRPCIASIILVLVLAGTAAAQIPQGQPPPSYGNTPAMLDGFQLRLFRTFQLNLNVTVPKAELQALLPACYTARDRDPANPDGTSRLMVNVYFQQRTELTADTAGFAKGTYGPVDQFNVLALVSDPHDAAVTLVLDSERSNDASVNLTNGIFGAGSTHRASRLDVKIDQESEDATIRFNARVKNRKIGLNVEVEVEVPSAIVGSSRTSSTTAAAPYQFLNGDTRPVTTNRRFDLAASYDFITVPTENIRITAHADRDGDDDDDGHHRRRGGRHMLGLPEGSVTILGVDATGTNQLRRWLELIIKLRD